MVNHHGLVVKTLGLGKTVALPAFHALTGTDKTGSFAGKGKVYLLENFPGKIICALTNLGTNETQVKRY